MVQPIRPFLMFQGRAEEAIACYVDLFDDARVLTTERFGPGEPGPEGAVKLATLSLNGLEVMVLESPTPHEFDFTPSISLFVTCPDRDAFDRLADGLSEGGSFLMPPGEYDFSARFAWVQDKFGVSWQLNLP